MIHGGACRDGLRRCIGGRIVFGAFTDPAANQLDLIVGKRLASKRHLRLGLTRYIADDQALLGRSSGEGRALASTRFDILHAGQRELSLSACALVASQTLPGQNGFDFPMETDGLLSAATRNKNRKKDVNKSVHSLSTGQPRPIKIIR